MSHRTCLAAVGILAWLTIAAPAVAADRLVSTGGSDWANNCLSTPCATVAHAVSVASAHDTIVVGPGNFLGDTIAISKPLTIRGADAAFTALISIGAGRVFDIDANVKAVFEKIAIRGGQTTGAGGGIRNAGSLTLKNVYIRYNQASCGGGVSNEEGGTLWMFETLVEGNVATTASGGPCAAGGGGLINAKGATATIEDSHILGNIAPTAGGIRNRGALTASRVLIELNEATGGRGGGLWSDDSGSADLVNTTFSGNSTPNVGGAIAATGPVDLTHVTIANNVAVEWGGGGIHVASPAGYAKVRNSIIAYNAGVQCRRDAGAAGIAVEIGGAGSIVSDNSCNLWPGYNQVGDPLLGPLAYNGGLLPTYALPSTSPAIDLGHKWFCVAVDQREFPRPVDGNGDGTAACDAGAFEFGSEASSGDPQPQRQKGWRRNGPWFPQGRRLVTERRIPGA